MSLKKNAPKNIYDNNFSSKKKKKIKTQLERKGLLNCIKCYMFLTESKRTNKTTSIGNGKAYK